MHLPYVCKLVVAKSDNFTAPACFYQRMAGDQGVRCFPPRSAFQPSLPRMERNIEKSAVLALTIKIPERYRPVKLKDRDCFTDTDIESTVRVGGNNASEEKVPMALMHSTMRPPTIILVFGWLFGHPFGVAVWGMTALGSAWGNVSYPSIWWRGAILLSLIFMLITIIVCLLRINMPPKSSN
ncbi:MAG: hypothetical protein JWN64_633 [Parcubacteria group bacterium]|nr:hypothetical protein [Parcubacteria group bacterium]